MENITWVECINRLYNRLHTTKLKNLIDHPSNIQIWCHSHKTILAGLQAYCAYTVFMSTGLLC